MKRSIALFLMLFLLGATSMLSTGCQKNKTGDLVINVVDNLNGSVGAGQTVYLYNNQADFNAGTYAKTATTNSSGQVTFTNLAPGTYYADCDWTSLVGLTFTSSGSGVVEAKMVTTITIAP
ncbi:MAG: SdrD B-like domain [Bacteroidota bacterium]|jgi:5-hydroxyisourate hydrolase-like protein (transthyretin family)